MAAPGKALFQPVQAALPLLHLRLRTEAVFEEEKLTARLQYAMDLRHGLLYVLDAAQGKGADDAIKAAVLEGKPLTAEDPLAHLDPRLLHPSLGQSVHAPVRIDGREFTDLLGVKGEVQPGPKANF